MHLKMKESVTNLIVEGDILEHVDIGVEINATEENLVTLDTIGLIMRRNPKMLIRNVKDVNRNHQAFIIVNSVEKIFVMDAQMIKHIQRKHLLVMSLIVTISTKFLMMTLSKWKTMM